MYDMWIYNDYRHTTSTTQTWKHVQLPRLRKWRYDGELIALVMPLNIRTLLPQPLSPISSNV